MTLSTGTVVFEDATLKVVELVAETMTLNNFSASSTTSLQQATNTGNVTTNTVEFTNPTTAFVTTGNVEVGTANLFVDTVSGRVGVGTGSPDLELHVHDANNANSGIVLSSTAGYNRLYEASGQLYIQSGTTASADSRADINFTSMYASTNYMKILGSNGNVGIGTASPSGTLHVNGENIYISSAAVSNCTWRIMPQTGNATKLFRIYDQDNARDRLVIDASGNVGIGTTSPTVSLYVQDSTPSQSNSNLDGLFVANSGTSGSFFNIQSATGNGRVFAVTNNGVGKFDGGVSGSAADYAEMFEWIDGNPDDEDRRGLVVELVGGDKIQVATSTTSESNIIGVVSAEPCVLAGESTFHWTSKWLKDDFGSYQMEDYEAWQYSKGSGEPTVVPVEGTEPGDLPEDAVKVTAKRRIFNPDYDDTIEYVPRSQRKEWSPVGVVGRLRVKKGQPARSSWVKLKDVSEMIEEWFIR